MAKLLGKSRFMKQVLEILKKKLRSFTVIKKIQLTLLV